jgi:hydroxyacylglutathione hydrolase
MPTLATAIVPVTPFEQNCTLIWDQDTRRAVVIDPGGNADRILAALTSQALIIEAIWLTHGHLDHAGGVKALNQSLPSPVPVIGPHRADQFLLDGIEQQARSFGLTGLSNATTDQYLEEGDILDLAGHSFEILHCPGHTPGHVVFVNRAARFAQVGDTLFAGSIGRTDFSYGSHDTLVAAIKSKLLPLGDDLRFTPGHGPASTIGRERTTNPFLR